MTGQTLLTGADGYLGRRIAEQLLADTDDRLILTVRAADRSEYLAKRESLQRELGGAAVGRIKIVAADLRDLEPFAAIEADTVTSIVHAAARTAFNVERDAALEVNIGGTARLTAFAQRCRRLERLLVLSTLYSAGRRVGPVTETAHEKAEHETEFVNFYEWSKCEVEQQLLAAGGDLPLSIARLATIVADDDTGEITQHNAFHNTLKLFFYGLLSLMPGDPQTPMYLATADFTSRGVAHLIRPEVPGGVYHLAPGPSEVVSLGTLMAVAFDTFEVDPGFRRRRLLRPPFCDIASFRDLVAASKGFGGGPMRDALASVAPFAEQMFLPKNFDNSRLRATWTEYATPAPRQLAEAACAGLVRTRWGRTREEVS